MISGVVSFVFEKNRPITSPMLFFSFFFFRRYPSLLQFPQIHQSACSAFQRRSGAQISLILSYMISCSSASTAHLCLLDWSLLLEFICMFLGYSMPLGNPGTILRWLSQ